MLTNVEALTPASPGGSERRARKVGRCRGITRDGDQCSHVSAPGNDYCYSHDPERSEERRANAARAGGTKRPTTTIKNLDDTLAKLAEDVLSGEVDKGAAAVVVQVVGARIRLLELERKMAERDELRQRFIQSGGVPW